MKLYPDFAKTDDYLPARISQRLSCKKWLAIASIILAFGTGFFVCRLTWPRQVAAKTEKEDATPTTKTEQNPRRKDRDLDSGVTQRADAKIISMLHESSNGVLEVKDNIAQTVLKNRAALGSKDGFTDLDNGSYAVHWYCVHNKTGYGIVEDGQRKVFLLKWDHGVIEPPKKITKITLPNGRRVEASN